MIGPVVYDPARIRLLYREDDGAKDKRSRATHKRISHSAASYRTTVLHNSPEGKLDRGFKKCVRARPLFCLLWLSSHERTCSSETKRLFALSAILFRREDTGSGEAWRRLLGDLTSDAASRAVQGLREGLTAVGEIRGEGVHVRKRIRACAVIDEFKGTPFGKRCRGWYDQNGWVVFPVLPHEHSSATSESMQTAVEEKLLEKITDNDGSVKGFEIPSKLNAAKINGKERYMMDFDKGKYFLGEEFLCVAEEAGRTIGFVLQALDYGPNDAADVEKLTMLLSAAGETVQVI